MSRAIVVDDHLLRGVLVGDPRPGLRRWLRTRELATTGLWYHRLCLSLARPGPAGKLSGPVAGLPDLLQARFRERLTTLPPDVRLISMRDVAWSMAEVRTRHHGLSTLAAEALAVAMVDGSTIAVWHEDVGPRLRDAAEAEGIDFRVVA